MPKTTAYENYAPADATPVKTHEAAPQTIMTTALRQLQNLTQRQKIAIGMLGFLYCFSWALSFAGVYDAFPVIDIPFHFFGGFFIGLLLIDTFRESLVAEHILWHDIAIIVGATLVIGFLWELHEYLLTFWVGKFFAARGITCCIGDAFDTLKDLLMDSLGGFSMFFLVRWRNRKSLMFT